MKIKTVLFVVCFILPLKVKFLFSAKVFAQDLGIEKKFQEKMPKFEEQEVFEEFKREIELEEKKERREGGGGIRKEEEWERGEEEKEEDGRREKKRRQREEIKQFKKNLIGIAENLYKELELIYSLNIENALETLEIFKNTNAKKISILFGGQENYNNAKFKLFILNNFPINEKNNLVFSINLFATSSCFIKYEGEKYYEDDNYSFNLLHNSTSFNIFFSNKNDYFNTNILFNFNKQVSENFEAKFTFKIKTFNLSYGIDIPIYDRLNVSFDAIYNLFIIQKSKLRAVDYSGYKTSNIILVPSAKFKLIKTRYKDIFDINLNLNTQYAYVTKKNKGTTRFDNEFLNIGLIIDFPQIDRSLFKFGTSLDVKIFDKFSVILSINKHYTKTLNYLEYGIKMKYDFDN